MPVQSRFWVSGIDRYIPLLAVIAWMVCGWPRASAGKRLLTAPRSLRLSGFGCSALSPANVPVPESQSGILRRFVLFIFSSNFHGLSTIERQHAFRNLWDVA